MEWKGMGSRLFMMWGFRKNICDPCGSPSQLTLSSQIPLPPLPCHCTLHVSFSVLRFLFLNYFDHLPDYSLSPPLSCKPHRTKTVFFIHQCSAYAAATGKSLQSCPTLYDPIDGSPPGSPVPGTLQARTLEWVAISFSNAWKWKGKVKLLSRVWFLATPWTATYQAPPPVGFSRQEYWSGVPLPSLMLLL